MARVTLARAWNPGNNRYVRGDTVEVNEATAAWLDRTGALAKPIEETAPEDDTSTDLEDHDAPDDEDEDVTPVESSDPEKPKKASSVDAWREYAEARGIETKGLTKAEIIAAVG